MSSQPVTISRSDGGNRANEIRAALDRLEVQKEHVLGLHEDQRAALGVYFESAVRLSSREENARASHQEALTKATAARDATAAKIKALREGAQEEGKAGGYAIPSNLKGRLSAPVQCPPLDVQSTDPLAALHRSVTQAALARREVEDRVAAWTTWRGRRTARRIMGGGILAGLIIGGAFAGYYWYHGEQQVASLGSAEAALQAGHYDEAAVDFQAAPSYAPALAELSQLNGDGFMHIARANPNASWITSGMGFAVHPSAVSTGEGAAVKWTFDVNNSTAAGNPDVVTVRLQSATVELPNGQQVAVSGNPTISVRRGATEHFDIGMGMNAHPRGRYLLSVSLDVQTANFKSQVDFQPVKSVFLFVDAKEAGAASGNSGLNNGNVVQGVSARVSGPVISASGNPPNPSATLQASVRADTNSASAPSRVLFQEDWTHGANGWTGTRDFQVTSGVLTNDGSREGYFLAPFVTPNSDYSVEAEIQLMKGNGIDMGLLARVTPGSNGAGPYADAYGLLLSSDRARIVDLYHRDLSTATINPGSNWYTYRLSVSGNRLQAFINGAQVTEVVGSQHPTGNRVAVYSHGIPFKLRSFRVLAP